MRTQDPHTPIAKSKSAISCGYQWVDKLANNDKRKNIVYDFDRMFNSQNPLQSESANVQDRDFGSIVNWGRGATLKRSHILEVTYIWQMFKQFDIGIIFIFKEYEIYAAYVKARMNGSLTLFFLTTTL